MFDQNYQKMKKKHHKHCMYNTDIFGLKISFNKDGILTASFKCGEKYQGYDGIVHGGVIASIIDSVMTKCLFGHNIMAYTVRLNIKYSFPVAVNKETAIEVILNKKTNRNTYNIVASLFQDRKKLVSADAKFWRV